MEDTQNKGPKMVHVEYERIYIPQGKIMEERMYVPKVHKEGFEYDLEGQELAGAVDFSLASVRRGFIKKVYSILTAQLLITFGFVALFQLNHELWKSTLENGLIMFGALLFSVATVMVILFSERARREFPHNFLLLLAFTLAEGFVVGIICGQYQSESVFLAVCVTAATCVGLTAFAFQTKYDFTGYGPYLFVASLNFLLFGLIATFFNSYFIVEDLFYNCMGVLLFAAYFIYDTQLILGGEHKFRISSEEYIFAALILYLDVINLLIKILRILGKKRN